MTATGLPGRPKNKVLRTGDLPSTGFRIPKAIGRPGRIAIFQKPTSPNSCMICLVKSASPTETPPEEIKTSALVAASINAFLSDAGSSRTMPQSIISRLRRFNKPVRL